MTDTNGTHVTWRELRLFVGPILEDVSEIKGDVKLILAAQDRAKGVASVRSAQAESHRWLTTVGVALLAAFIAASSTLVAAAFLH